MNYIDIKPNDVINGEGIMVSLWTSGCPHHCKGCFNLETWDYKAGEEFKNEHIDYILELLDKDGINRNLSILGGEPLCEENIDMVLYLSKIVKERRPSTIIYVWTGYLYEELLEENEDYMFKNIDYIIDGKFELKNKDLKLKLRGSSNQRIIDIKETLKNNKIISCG